MPSLWVTPKHKVIRIWNLYLHGRIDNRQLPHLYSLCPCVRLSVVSCIHVASYCKIGNINHMLEKQRSMSLSPEDCPVCISVCELCFALPYIGFAVKLNLSFSESRTIMFWFLKVWGLAIIPISWTVYYSSQRRAGNACAQIVSAIYVL